MENEKLIGDSASVKVMNSYDYCHFEVCLSKKNSEAVTTKDVDDMRKDAQRLVDKAIAQYKIAKQAEQVRIEAECSAKRLERRLERIKKEVPESEWTPEHKAQVKALADHQFRMSLCYDYEDDWAY